MRGRTDATDGSVRTSLVPCGASRAFHAPHRPIGPTSPRLSATESPTLHPILTRMTFPSGSSTDRTAHRIARRGRLRRQGAGGRLPPGPAAGVSLTTSGWAALKDELLRLSNLAEYERQQVNVTSLLRPAWAEALRHVERFAVDAEVGPPPPLPNCPFRSGFPGIRSGTGPAEGGSGGAVEEFPGRPESD